MFEDREKRVSVLGGVAFETAGGRALAISCLGNWENGAL